MFEYSTILKLILLGNSHKSRFLVPEVLFSQFLIISNNSLEKLVAQIDYEVIFVCDPSSDETLPKLKELSNVDPKKYKTILMSRRFGQHACIIAGLNHSLSDAFVVVMDIDGQDPVSLLPNMIDKWQEGYEVVYARRTKREGLNIINKLSAKIGLYLISKLSYIDIPRNVGEYRLMDIPL